jgi:DNA primase
VSHAETDPKVTITAVVTRADGTVEDLGVVASNTTTGSKGLVILKKIMKGRTNAG